VDENVRVERREQKTKEGKESRKTKGEPRVRETSAEQESEQTLFEIFLN